MIMNITNDTPVTFLTVGQLKEILRADQSIQKTPSAQEKPKKYVYGLRGIRELFGCSHATAQRYKDTIIKDAVIQNGRKLIIDSDLAIELFKNSKSGGDK